MPSSRSSRKSVRLRLPDYNVPLSLHAKVLDFLKLLPTRLAFGLLNIGVNLRSNLSICPLLQPAGGKRVGDSNGVLAGADIRFSILYCRSLDFLLVCCCRGFFCFEYS